MASGKKVTTYGEVTGVWDPDTSQVTVVFLPNTVEITAWMKTLEGIHSITMNLWFFYSQ